MESKSLIVGVIFGLLIGLILGYSIVPKASEYETRIAAFENQIATLNSQIASLNTRNLEFIAVSFSRVDDTSSLICTWIDKANSTIDVAVYSFTQYSIGDALVAAKARGVNVRVVMEHDTISDSGSEYSWLQSKGISIRTDSSEGLMHNKFFVIDGSIVGTGSFNWTKSAENDNDENLLIVRSESLANKYLNEFNYLWRN